MIGKRKYFPGEKRGELTYVETIKGGDGYFKCSCGVIKKIRTNHVFSGAVKSCGCKRAEYVSKARYTPGVRENGKQTSEYTIWKGMKQRCNNKNAPKWHRYGGRGISVCERWQTSFSNFLDDMGRRPTNKHSIERMNNDGNYEPGNCRWATAKEQAYNTSRVLKYIYDGELMTIREIATIIGVKKGTLDSRIRKYGYEIAMSHFSPQDSGMPASKSSASLCIIRA